MWESVDDTPTTVETVLLRTDLAVATVGVAVEALVARGLSSRRRVVVPDGPVGRTTAPCRPVSGCVGLGGCHPEPRRRAVSSSSWARLDTAAVGISVDPWNVPGKECSSTVTPASRSRRA